MVSDFDWFQRNHRNETEKNFDRNETDETKLEKKINRNETNETKLKKSSDEDIFLSY